MHLPLTKKVKEEKNFVAGFHPNVGKIFTAFVSSV